MVFVTRLVLKNYRSIAACDCSLGPLTFVVGPNGAGKTNLLDGLRFVRDALRESVRDAVERRGGFPALRRWPSGRSGPIGVQVDLTLPLIPKGRYAFLLEGRRNGTVEVLREECTVCPRGGGLHSYRVRTGELFSTDRSAATVPRDRLYLEEAAVSGPFQAVHAALAGMCFPERDSAGSGVSRLADPADAVAGDWAALVGVIQRLARKYPGRLEALQEYLRGIVPAVRGVRVRSVGGQQTLEFALAQAAGRRPRWVSAASVSGGTLQALRVLAALADSGGAESPLLVAPEHPETGLFPAACGVLLDALRDASGRAQVIVTTHSADLLDSHDLPADKILAVSSREGITSVGSLDDAVRQAIQLGTYTPGELLRLGQLMPVHLDQAPLRERRPYPGAVLRRSDAGPRAGWNELAWAKEAERRDEEMGERVDAGIPAGQVFRQLRRPRR